MTGGISPTRQEGLGLTVLRYLVSVVAVGLVLGAVMTSLLDAILASLGFPIGLIAAVVIGLPLALFMRRMGWRRFYHALIAGAALGFVAGLPFAAAPLTQLPAAIGLGMGLGVLAWSALKAQTLPLRFVPPRWLATTSWALAAGVLLICSGAVYGVMVAIYGPAPPPESFRTVAAFEAPLPTDAARARFMAVLRTEALAEGMHVDAAGKAELEQMTQAMPEAGAALDAAVYRGAKDNRIEVTASDRFHPGLVWITFLRGEDEELARRFRERVMARIHEEWPETLSLPVTPTGAIPNAEDLIRTPDGYRVKASAAARYELAATSPLVASDVPAGGAVSGGPAR